MLPEFGGRASVISPETRAVLPRYAAKSGLIVGIERRRLTFNFRSAR
jgi:hypothetical protein